MPHDHVDIAAVRRLCAEATEGPWEFAEWDKRLITPETMEAIGCKRTDIDFIAASRTLVPAMADEIERLRRLLERVEESMVDYGYAHGDECGCEQCDILADVRRVNEETPDE